MALSVLHFIVCERVSVDSNNLHSLDVIGLTWSIRSTIADPFPLVVPELTVLAIFMGGEGRGEFLIRVVQDGTGRVVTKSRIPHGINFVGGSYGVHGMKGLVQNCTFRTPGVYWVELVIGGAVAARQPIKIISEVYNGESQ